MSHIVSCGIDIIAIERVRSLYERYGDRFLGKVYAESERLKARTWHDPGPFLAGRFAAKEAALKVLGCGLFSGIRLRELEIRAKETGEPYCVLTGRARERARELGISAIMVSISHCEAYAVAQAIGVRS